MVELNRIYTRGGDAGKTSLGSGDRVAKHDLRVAAYGTVDETNAALGLARLHTGDDPLTNDMIARIQNDLFDLGADLCTPEGDARAAQKKQNHGVLLKNRCWSLYCFLRIFTIRRCP